MSNGTGPQKLVQIPEETYKKMREKLKKQEEKIKAIEEQNLSPEGGSVLNPAQRDEMVEFLNNKVKEMEDIIANQKEELNRLIEKEPDSIDITPLTNDIAEKEETIKRLVEREKQLLEALENQSNSRGYDELPFGIRKGLMHLKRHVDEMQKREEFIEILFSKILQAKETMDQLSQQLNSLPTNDDMEIEIRQMLLESIGSETESSRQLTYEAHIESIKNQLESSDSVKSKILTEQEKITIQKEELVRSFETINGSLEAMTKLIKDKEQRLVSARDFVASKYNEWKAQDEMREKEMESLGGLI